MTDTTCPACGRAFRSLKGRSGHLATFNDGTHASYRQAHGMRIPLGPDHKPTKAGARVRGKGHRTAPTRPVGQPAPVPVPTDNAADLKRALQELTEKSLEANRAREQERAAQRAWQPALEPATSPPPATPAPIATAPPSAPAAKPEPDSPPPASPSKTPGEGWLIAGGVAAAGAGLAAAVMKLKGANAPKPEQFPEAPTGRPPMSLPEGIWAKPETAPKTTGNDWLDHHLGYSGGVKTRKRGIL